MKGILLILLLYFAVTYANKYVENKCTKDENGHEFCEKSGVDDEDEEPCFYEDPKESLFQWDPIKVSLSIHLK